jgi:hypothetical protein
LPDYFSDGTSKTIMFTEKLAWCQGTINNTQLAGGNFWGYPPVPYPNNGSPTLLQIQNLSGVLLVPDGYLPVPASGNFEPIFRPINGGCDPGVASTGNGNTIIVAMADGSTRNIASSIRGVSSQTSGETIWYTLLTPGNSDNKGEDVDY